MIMDNTQSAVGFCSNRNESDDIVFLSTKPAVYETPSRHVFSSSRDCLDSKQQKKPGPVNITKFVAAFATTVTKESKYSLELVAKNGDESLYKTFQRIFPRVISSYPLNFVYKFEKFSLCSSLFNQKDRIVAAE